MKRLLLLLCPLVAACQNPADQNSGAATPTSVGPDLVAPVAAGDLEAFMASAKKNGAVFQLPKFETTPAEVQERVTMTLQMAQEALDLIAAQDPTTVSFSGSFAAMDDAIYPVMTVLNRMWLMKETQPDATMREACGAAVQEMESWMVGVSFREDLYALCAGFDERFRDGSTHRLAGEHLKLYEDTMRDYRRAGFALDSATRAEVEVLLNKRNELSTVFDTNITNAARVVVFSEEDLEGVPSSFLDSARNSAGAYDVRAHVTPDYIAVMGNAVRESTRETLMRARYTLAMEENGPVLDELVATRAQIADLLGYDSWADYQIEPKMAGDGATALAFVEDLIAGLEPKFQQELAVLTAIKRESSGNPEAVINQWDFRWAQNQLMKAEYGVDSDALRAYFPLDRVLDGMFASYQRIFNLEFRQVEPPQKWVDDLRLYTVSDARTGKPMGAFYLDLYPRTGKYNHFAQFDIIGGKKRAGGRYQRPVVALVCNFTPGLGDEPALMNHGEVETIFHEFGHAMHSILTRAEYAQFAGANVARDFVEAPSQMFEAWAWDPEVLATFAARWDDPNDRLPMATVAAMKEAELATVAVSYRRQMGLALSDLRLHVGTEGSAQEVINAANSEATFPLPDDTHFGAYWGHLTGYDAGYYGYGWADSIAADMATVFESAPQRFFDVEAGMRLRNEIYAVGSTRPVAESVRAFLGRDPQPDAFLNTLGIGD